jgi:DNA primase
MEFIEHLKSAVDIVQVVGEYVRLKRSGAGPRYTGLCPFHTEKTGSFSVHSTHQFYKCFGCGAGGDVIKFVMEIERLTFWEAVRHLAERNGIPLPKRNDVSDDEARARGGILEMHDLAAQVFSAELFSADGEAARDYIKRRGLTRPTTEEFGLGLSPRGGQTLVRLFEKRGYKPEEMEASGLVLRRTDGSGCFDRFRGRLMFPIQAESGRVIAFGGRALAEGDEPKYLNSPETSVYRKSHVLYNLHRARKPAQEAGFAILVEGYMDVIGVAAAGVANVVATCGTALTNHQARSLRRHAPELVVNFDPDKAGVKATERSIPILLEEGLRLKVLALADGLDPDEYIQKFGVDGYQEVLRNARGYFHWLADRARERFDLHTPDGRLGAYRFLLPTIEKMPDRLDRLAVANDVAEYLKMEPGVVLDEFRRAATERRGQVKKHEPPPPEGPEVLLLHALMGEAEARAQIAPLLARPNALMRLQARGIFEAALRVIEQGETPTYSNIEARLEEADRELLARLILADDTLTEGFTIEQAMACARRLSADEQATHREQLRERIREAERAGDSSSAMQLLSELADLERRPANAPG